MESGKRLIFLFFLGTVSASFPSPGFELTTEEETDPRFKTFHPYSENDNTVSVGLENDKKSIDILVAGPAVEPKEDLETTRKDKKVAMKFLNSPKFEGLRKKFPTLEGRSKPQSRPSRDIKVRRYINGNRLGNVNQPILLPAEDTNRFPHSMVNNKHFRPVDIAMMNSKPNRGRSRSYVYKNMAGKGYLYAVSHNNNEEVDSGSNTELEGPNYNDVNTRFNSDGDVETVGPIRPPDLSRDTRVNPNGRSNNQGATMIDPDSEVFDLSLVIKEMESRANEE